MAAQQLQLEVFINGAPSDLIGSFSTEDGTHLSVEPAELGELGLDPDRFKDDGGPVRLDEVNGLKYRYDVAGQRIYLTVDDGLRGTIAYDAAPQGGGTEISPTGYGAVLNYNLFAAAGAESRLTDAAFNGVSASFDARAFSPLGTLGQSAIVRLAEGGRAEALRIDTTLTYSDPGSMMTYRAGDIVSGGFAWTRPVRMGGLQARRNFSLRPDLITQPLASVGGTAAVPSTVEVYVDNLKAYSRDIGAGNYRIDNIPVANGAGEARLILRDAAGREQQATIPFYASPNLLRPRLTDISVEVGVPRHGYATPDDTYLTDTPVVSASLRRGLTDWLTLEAHAEGGEKLLNGGAGLVARTGTFGIASLALSGSHGDGAGGLQAYAAYETSIGDVELRASSQVAFGAYGDLASLSGERSLSGKNLDFLKLVDDDADFRPPRMINQISASMPISFDDGSISASFIDLHRADGDRSAILAASYSRPLPLGGSFGATAFADFAGDRNMGLFAGVSFPLGGTGATATTAVSSSRDATELVASAVKPLGAAAGSAGWRVAAGLGSAEAQSAALSYRSRYGWAEASVSRQGENLAGTAQVDGAVAGLGTGVFLTSRIDDAFAVVETGLPGVRVLYENRPMGVTDANGRLLVPDVRSYQRNKFSIETLDFPVNVDVPTTVREVAPADRSGVLVDLKARRESGAAIVVLTGDDGAPLPAGSYGRLNDSTDFVVGYDGRAFLKDLGDRNYAVVTGESGSCRAEFGYRPKGDQQVVIPVTCH